MCKTIFEWWQRGCWLRASQMDFYVWLLFPAQYYTLFIYFVLFSYSLALSLSFGAFITFLVPLCLIMPLLLKYYTDVEFNENNLYFAFFLQMLFTNFNTINGGFVGIFTHSQPANIWIYRFGQNVIDAPSKQLETFQRKCCNSSRDVRVFLKIVCNISFYIFISFLFIVVRLCPLFSDGLSYEMSNMLRLFFRGYCCLCYFIVVDVRFLHCSTLLNWMLLSRILYTVTVYPLLKW